MSAAVRPLRGLLSMLRPARARLAVAFLAFLLKDSPFWVLPIVTSAVVDTVVNRGGIGDLLVAGLIGLGLVVLNYPANLLWVKLFSTTVRDLAVDLRNQLAHRLQTLSIGFHSRANSSVIQTKVVRDVENVELMLQQGVGPMLSALGVLVGAGVTLAIQVPQFLIVFALVVPLSALLIRWIRSRSEERNETFRRDVEHFSSRVGEMASLLPITRAHGLEPTATERVVSGARSVRDSGLSLDIVNGRFSALAWVTFQVLTIGCLLAAAAASLTDFLPITPGQVVLLSTYFVTMTNSIVTLFNLTPLVTKGRESLKSIAEVLEDPDVELNQGKTPVSEVAGDLNFESVTFEYPDARSPAVSEVTLRIAAGETVAFVGRSGSGKSTLLNLALGFLRPSIGRILLDGVDMQSLDLRTARRFVSVVPQESVLFSGSIRDNITYGLTGVSDERVDAALRDANALDVTAALPHGLATVVGERGARLSGGQRQRISIARALIRNPRILLLDEATSALDSESEKLVQDALATLMRGRTTLVVAHRLSTIRSADRIVVLDDGRIVEQGTHDELIAQRGLYSRLAVAQSG